MAHSTNLPHHVLVTMSSRWEILTYGDYPFAGIQLERIQDLVREGLRLKKPTKCMYFGEGLC